MPIYGNDLFRAPYMSVNDLSKAVKVSVVDNTSCRNYDGDKMGCSHKEGCAYYTCSDQCHPIGTSNQQF